MKRYSPEFKEAVIRKMMPPANVPIMRLAEESGVSYVTLAKWREEARSGGEAAPGNGEQPERWSSEDKFLIVLETHPLNAAERGTAKTTDRGLREKYFGWEVPVE